MLICQHKELPKFPFRWWHHSIWWNLITPILVWSAYSSTLVCIAKKLWLVPRSVGLVESSAYHLKISDHLWTHHVHCWLRAFQGSSFGPSGAAKSMSDLWRPAPPSHVVPGIIKGPMTSIPNSQEIMAELGKKRSQSTVSIPDASRFHAAHILQVTCPHIGQFQSGRGWATCEIKRWMKKRRNRTNKWVSWWKFIKMRKVAKLQASESCW